MAMLRLARERASAAKTGFSEAQESDVSDDQGWVKCSPGKALVRPEGESVVSKCGPA